MPLEVDSERGESHWHAVRRVVTQEMPTSRGLEPLEPGATPPEWWAPRFSQELRASLISGSCRCRSFVPVTDLFLVVGEGLAGSLGCV